MIGHRDVPSELDAMIARELHLGFSDDEQIVEEATEQFPDHDEPVVRAALAAALEKRALEERAWPETTDCDRLDQAFAALEAEGVVARQSFWCCTSCAIPAIKTEMMDEEARGTAVRGYVYFHWSMLDDAASGGPLSLQCGVAIADDDDDDDASARISERVTHALKRAGLAAERTGKWSVQVAIDWQKRRRALPPPDGAKSIEEHVTAWELELATMSLHYLPNMCPIELGPALVSAGAGELAARWASRSTRAGMAELTARALADDGKEALAREVLLAAYRQHPSVARRFDNDLTTALTRDPALSYIDLLLRGGLSDDVVARVAVARISPLPPTLFAAAAKAWLACLMQQAGRPISKRQVESWIGDSRAIWSQDEEDPYEGPDAGEGRVLLAAALWSYPTPEESKGYTDPAFGWLGAEPIDLPGSLARRGAFRAFALEEDLESYVDEVASYAGPDLVEEMIAAGETDLARSLVPKLHGDDRTLALIALGELPPVDAKATKELVSQLETSHQDGLITDTELELGRIVAAHALAASGDPESAFARIAPILEEKVAGSKAEVAAARATLDQAAAASFEIDWAARAPDDSTAEWTPVNERSLERNLRLVTAPEAEDLREARPRLRSLARSLVKLAAVDRRRSSKIFDDVVKRWGVNVAWWAECVNVMMAIGRLDEALELDRSPPAPRIEPRVSLELARRLLLAGRRDDALERVVALLAAGACPRELLDVGLLLLSLAPPEKRPAIAARLHAAYDRAIVVLDELAPPPQAAPGAVS